MSADLLDLARMGSVKRAPLEELRARLAAHSRCPAERIVILPTPEAAGLLDLPAGRCEVVGPDTAPLTAFFAEAPVDPRPFEGLLSDQAVDAGLSAMRPAARAQIERDKREKKQLINKLKEQFQVWNEIESTEISDGGLGVIAADPNGFVGRCRALGILVEMSGKHWWLPRLSLADARELAQRLEVRNGRQAQVRRTTKETDIHVALAIEESGPVRIATGIEYFDHMLEQIARHGGLSLEIVCEGDTGVDAHHTIEDVCLAFGDALAQALGDRRGIGRFGFELPMDETRAGVWIDLSGRPYCRFEGDIPGERVGEFPVEMTPHAFRSIADALKAAIHVEVSGENAHHMIEACFKAFGRALRQAVRVEGDAIPSTKGVL